MSVLEQISELNNLSAAWMEKQTIHVVLLCNENSIFLSRSKQIFLKLLNLLRVFLQINVCLNFQIIR